MACENSAFEENNYANIKEVDHSGIELQEHSSIGQQSDAGNGNTYITNGNEKNIEATKIRSKKLNKGILIGLFAFAVVIVTLLIIGIVLQSAIYAEVRSLSEAKATSAPPKNIELPQETKSPSTRVCDLSKYCSGIGYIKKSSEMGQAVEFVTTCAKKIFIPIADYDQVSVFSYNLTFEYKFGENGRGNGQFQYPFGISCWENKKVYISDRDNNRVCSFLVDGTFIQCFGSYGTGPGQLNHPHGNAIYDNKLYVTEILNNRISVFDLNGKFIKVLGPYSVPIDVFVTSKGEMVITECNGNQPTIYDLRDEEVIKVLNGTTKYQRQISDDEVGNILISDADSNLKSIAVYNKDFNHLCNIRLPFRPNGLHVTDDCNIIVTDWNRAYLYNPIETKGND